MKQTKATILPLLSLLLVLLLTLAACAPVPASWEDATYRKDATLGEGDTTISVKVTAEEKTITLTLHTDATTLEEALVAEELVSGDESAFGLYIKYVNGIRADYEKDNGYYWGLKVNGKTADTGASSVLIEEGGVYELVRTK